MSRGTERREIGLAARGALALVLLFGVAACTPSSPEPKVPKPEHAAGYIPPVALKSLLEDGLSAYRDWGTIVTGGIVSIDRVQTVDTRPATMVPFTDIVLIPESRTTRVSGRFFNNEQEFKSGERSIPFTSISQGGVNPLSKTDRYYVVVAGQVVGPQGEYKFVLKGPVRKAVNIAAIDPEKWELSDPNRCDPINPGTSGQQWVIVGLDGNPVASQFSFDQPDPKCA